LSTAPNLSPESSVADRRLRLAEICAVALTGIGFLAIPKPPDAILPITVFIVVAISLWSIVPAIRIAGNRTLLNRWGLKPTSNIRTLTTVLAPILLGLLGIGVLLAYTLGRPLWPEAIVYTLLLYPIWGLIQQFLVQAMLIDNIRALSGLQLPWLMALGGVCFGIVHIKHPYLVLATAPMGAVYVYLFQRWRNLWPLALCHGWLGAFFYPWILQLNPLAEMLEQLDAL